MEFYVYQHRRIDTGEVFYIGKGSGKRAWKKSSRTEWWKRIVAKAGGRTVEIVFRCSDEQEAFNKEAELIAGCGFLKLCNMRGGGEGGYSQTEEMKEMARKRMTGRIVSDATREKMRAASTGRRHGEETKAKIRAANIGKKRSPLSDAAKKALSDSRKGKVRSPEHCRAISEAKKGVKTGRKMDETTRAALLAANLGRKVTNESRRKMSESSKGKRHTPETVEKMTAINRKNNAERRKPILCSNGMLFGHSSEAELWLRDSGKPTASRTNIVSCCTGRLKTAYGFTWRYAMNST